MSRIYFKTRIDRQDIREAFPGHFCAYIRGEVEGIAQGQFGTKTICNEIWTDAEGASPDMTMQQAMSNFQFKVQEAKYNIEQSLMGWRG